MTGQVIRRGRILAACLLLLGLAGQAAAQSLPHVRLVATGGTISDRGDRRLTHEELLASAPGIARHARASSEQFANVASGNLTLDQWLELSRRLNTLFAGDPELAGLVVSSGTDTLEELAYFLHLTVRDVRPVVVVGAMRKPGTLYADGTGNLEDAFQVAAHPASRGRGVLVVLGGDIHGARAVTKADANRVDAFRSPPDGPIGYVDANGMGYFPEANATREWAHTARSEFDVFAIDALPRVDVLLAYQDAPGDLVNAAVGLGARGLVLAALGAGASSASQAEAVARAAAIGVVVVRTSRTGAGQVQPGAAASILGGGDLTPVKARVLLMLALTATSRPDTIQRIFERY